MNHGYKPRNKLRGIRYLLMRYNSTKKFQFTLFLKYESPLPYRHFVPGIISNIQRLLDSSTYSSNFAMLVFRESHYHLRFKLRYARFQRVSLIPLAAMMPEIAAPTMPRLLPVPSPATKMPLMFVSRWRSVGKCVSKNFISGAYINVDG